MVSAFKVQSLMSTWAWLRCPVLVICDIIFSDTNLKWFKELHLEDLQAVCLVLEEKAMFKSEQVYVFLKALCSGWEGQHFPLSNFQCLQSDSHFCCCCCFFLNQIFYLESAFWDSPYFEQVERD